MNELRELIKRRYKAGIYTEDDIREHFGEEYIPKGVKPRQIYIPVCFECERRLWDEEDRHEIQNEVYCEDCKNQ